MRIGLYTCCYDDDDVVEDDDDDVVEDDDDDDTSPPAVSTVCLAEITRSRVWSGTAIPAVSRSATIAMAASSSPRSTHIEITSS